jgi:proteic killer suppression protein
MIKTFKCKETERLFLLGYTEKFPSTIIKRAKHKLALLNAALNINDLTIPPSNRLHALTGDKVGQFSISINMKWRICFVWENNNALEVEIVDYH